MSKPIPDGYSYTRCDSYTRDEFLAKYGEEKQADICKKYVEKNPKDCYTTDDEIAIHEMLKERIVNSLAEGFGGHTTKRYRIYEERY